MSEVEVLRLRAEVAELRIAVQALTERVAALESAEGFEVVHTQVAASAASPPRAPPGRQVSSAAPSEASQRRASVAENESGRDPERVSVAREVGRFLRRAYRGEHRGASGRDKVSLASRYYIVLAPYSGELYNTARVYSKFAPVKALCKRGPDAGRSVFIGLPTLWETSLALQEAGFDWPEGGVDAE